MDDPERPPGGPPAGEPPDREPPEREPDGGEPDGGQPGAGDPPPAAPHPSEPAGPAPDRRLLARLGVDPGLCATCIHLRLLASPRSVFVRCGLAATDPRFPRYPPLPVLACDGWQPAEP
jgi:hypothetical protein